MCWSVTGVLSDAFLSLPLPCFYCRGLLPLAGCTFQALCIWLLLGLATGRHWPRTRRRKGTLRSRPSLCPAVSLAAACLLMPSPASKVPHGSASLSYPSSRVPRTSPLPLSLWLRVVTSCSRRLLGSSLP